MVSVYVLSLFFGKSDQESLVRNFLRALSESMPDHVSQGKLDVKLGFSGGPLMGGIVFDSWDLSKEYPTMEVDRVLIPVETPVRVHRSHKGDAIRFWLDWYREFGDKDSVAIYVDGEGISPRQVWKHLESLPRGGATLSLRTNPDWGIGEERKLAEMFELWLVGRIFGIDPPPDGQCGLWALSWEAVHAVNLSSRTFEVELDLLTELLINRVPLRFISVEVEPLGETTFRKRDHRRKLLFLAAKFKLSPEALVEELESFRRGLGGSLSEIEEAVREVSSLIKKVPNYRSIYRRVPPIYEGTANILGGWRPPPS